MSRPEDQIVFEDLHGANEDEPITIDLDASTKDDGITRTPADQAADAVAAADDDIQLDSLRSVNEDDDDSQKTDVKADDDDDASKTGEDDDYSKKVKARIGREQRAKRKAQSEAGYWKEQAERLAKDNNERDRKSLKSVIERTNSDIEQVQTDLEAAIEGGQTKDQVRLTNKLTDLKTDKARAEFGLDDLPENGNLQPFDGKVSSTTSETSTEADNWMESHVDWYGTKGFERQTRLARRLDREVFKDGYDPNSTEYFEELDKRLKLKSPELYEDVDASADELEDKDDRTKRGKNIVAPVGTEGNRRQRRNSGKVQLTPEDFDTMRQFNLDTNDPEVLKEFARNKLEAEKGEQ